MGFDPNFGDVRQYEHLAAATRSKQADQEMYDADAARQPGWTFVERMRIDEAMTPVRDLIANPDDRDRAGAAQFVDDRRGGALGTPASGAPEATGLTSAVAYAQTMAQMFSGNAASTEQWIASLQGNGGVSGPAVAAAHQAAEKQQEAAAAWAACAAALGGHTSVREAYQANQGAGTREFVTND